MSKRHKTENTKKTKENINKNRKDVAVMLCCSSWSNHADVTKHSTQNRKQKNKKHKQKHKRCCSNALPLTLVQPCRYPILFLSCFQSQCCLSAGEKVSLIVEQLKRKNEEKMKKEKIESFTVFGHYSLRAHINFFAEECTLGCFRIAL